MADGLNRVYLLGNIGADPELRVTPNGGSVLKIRMATSETYMDKNRVKQEKAEWHSVVVWGKQAEALGKFLQKGSKIHVEGSLQTRSWDKDGQKHYATEVNARSILAVGGAGSQNRGEPKSDTNGYDEGGDDVPY
jgi:single-strand DNA-binding protein